MISEILLLARVCLSLRALVNSRITQNPHRKRPQVLNQREYFNSS